MAKKGATPLAIGMVIVLSILLLFMAWGKSLARTEQIVLRIEGAHVVERAYEMESIVNFHISEIVRRSAAEVSRESASAEADFLRRFERNLRDSGLLMSVPEMAFVPPQLDASRVSVENDSVTLTLRLRTESRAEIDGRTVASVEHIYWKNFTAQLGER
jgi:hypothetical protein